MPVGERVMYSWVFGCQEIFHGAGLKKIASPPNEHRQAGPQGSAGRLTGGAERGASQAGQAVPRSRSGLTFECARRASNVTSDQLKLAGSADRLAAASRGQLAADVFEVRLDGVGGDVHLAGDFGAGQQA